MPDLGEKHECPKCGAKFYDLGKADASCPRCGPPEEDAQDDKDRKGSKDDEE